MAACGSLCCGGGGPRDGSGVSGPRPTAAVLSWWRANGLQCGSECENLSGNQKGGEEAGAV